jgi:hypothetical protein
MQGDSRIAKMGYRIWKIVVLGFWNHWWALMNTDVGEGLSRDADFVDLLGWGIFNIAAPDGSTGSPCRSVPAGPDRSRF